MIDSVDVLGVSVRRLSAQQAVQMVVQAADERRAIAFAFANANLLNVASKDRSFSQLLTSFVVLNDGSGVNLAAKVLSGKGFSENMNGTDFIPKLLGAVNRPLNVYFVGATQVIIDRAAKEFAKKWPQHHLCGYRNGFVAKAEWPEVFKQIQGGSPDIVLVGMGNGLQERFCSELLQHVRAPIFAVGALFDFWAGAHPRAPAWMRRMGIEWLFRLSREPSRLWRRYVLGNPAFLLRVFLQRVGLRLY